MKQGLRGTGFYESKKWMKIRDEVRKRDKMTCQRCGKFGRGRFIVDHIEPVSIADLKLNNEEKLYGLDNLQLLCQQCHNEKTAEDERKNSSKTLANRTLF